ncbi:MAG: hypothetical protein HUJ71_05945 [Pseudobutyrivibrio sp.]|nr:hypothetical protein [Pseudobutyrivibrio sp.]
MKLQFYKKGIPIKRIRRIMYLIVVFVISIGVFEVMTNQKVSQIVTYMDDPTFPVLTVSYFDDASMVLHGYATQMDPCYMRDALIPLSEDRMVNLSLNAFGNKVNGLSYELRSLDTSRKISGKALEYTRVGDQFNANLQVDNLIEKNEEYLLIVTADCDNKKIYFYTRVIEPTNCYERECYDFAKDFHDVSMSDDYSALATYMETSPYADKDTLYHVDINSSLTQVGYANFTGQQSTDLTCTITDINSTYTSLTFHYQMKDVHSRYTEIYNVSEYFRVRYTPDRIYLLAYDRTMEQILDKSTIDIKDNLISIGVCNDNVQYLSNETGTVVSFVQSGELYQYNQNERQLKKIFSFMNNNREDIRSNYDQHSIKILNIDESGTMDFVVYGYMNAGDHEGQCGINLYHYDSITGDSTEQVFINSASSYQILNSNFSELLYETADNEFYIMFNGTLLHMYLNQLTTSELMTGLKDSQYAVSSSGRYIALMDDPNASEAIHILDLESGDKYDIKAKDNQLLKPLQFIGDDLVYGSIYSNTVTVDAAGSTIYPMYKLTISDVSGNKEQTLMNYQKKGYYVTDAKLDSYTLYLDRITIEDDVIHIASIDTIQNSAGEQNKAVPIATSIDAIKGKIVTMNMATLGANEKLGKVDFSTAGMVSANSGRDISVSTTKSNNEYYVYVGSNVTLSTDNLTAAILSADENMGVVINNAQQYIWKRGRKAYCNAFNGMTVGSNDTEADGISKALSSMLVHEGENLQVHILLEQGETPISILQRSLKDYTVLDLSRCSLGEALYYVSIGNPVYAKTSEDTAVLIVGYDAANIIYYDPVNMKYVKMGLNDSTEWFESNGNIFISYVK